MSRALGRADELQQAVHLARNVFCQPGGRYVRQPAENGLTRHAADAAVGVEIGVREVPSVVSQQQIGTTDVGGGIAATRVGSIDDERPRGVAQDVDGMKIAVAQALAVRHVGETAEQGHPARRVQKLVPAMFVASRSLRLPSWSAGWA